jgi:hypothetical protein
MLGRVVDRAYRYMSDLKRLILGIEKLKEIT